MRVFYSVGADQYLRILMEQNIKNVLISFAYQPLLDKGHELLRRNEVKLFYDSGAFTAWTVGKEVDKAAYKANLRKYDDLIEMAANIDVIPGRQGEPITFEQAALAAEQGWKNFEEFRNEGFNKVIHIFHQGDDFKYLKMLIKECDYFGVSPSNDCSTKQKEEWLDHVFRMIEAAGGRKTHAFGVTSEHLMKRYPWYTVDSSSWALSAGYGMAKVFPYGQYLFSDRGLTDSKHFLTKPEFERQKVEAILNNEGFTVKGISGNPYDRVRMNIISLLKMEKQINESGHLTHYLSQPSLFGFEEDFVPDITEEKAIELMRDEFGMSLTYDGVASKDNSKGDADISQCSLC